MTKAGEINARSARLMVLLFSMQKPYGQSWYLSSLTRQASDGILSPEDWAVVWIGVSLMNEYMFDPDGGTVLASKYPHARPSKAV